jgi:hypothetical protein
MFSIGLQKPQRRPIMIIAFSSIEVPCPLCKAAQEPIEHPCLPRNCRSTYINK